MTNLGALLGRADPGRPVPTGFRDLDLLLAGGMRPGELVAISGYPGIGASTLALDLARNAAIAHGLGTHFATLESTIPQTSRRITAAESRVPALRLASGRLKDDDAERVARAGERTADAPLRITDSRRDVGSIVLDNAGDPAGTQRRLLVVDGVHLLNPSHDYGGRAQFADDFARDLKELAVTLDISVVVTLPLEFPFADRPGNYPLLRDFGKRQSFAAAADIVILIHREDHYERESPRAGEADLIVAKSRNSPLATITVAFQGHYARFVDMAMS